MRMSKSQALNHWQGLQENQPVNQDVIPYKHSGSTYGADGVRIEGSQEFIDSVLSRLKDLIAGENTQTRLGLNYQQVEAKPGKPNAFAGNWVCYVKLHERGGEAQMVNAFASAIAKKETIITRGH